MSSTSKNLFTKNYYNVVEHLLENLNKFSFNKLVNKAIRILFSIKTCQKFQKF